MEIEIKEEKVPAEHLRIYAENGGKVVGRAYLYVIQNENRDGAKYGILGEVRVEPEARSQGIGKRLTQAVIDKAKEMGCYKLLAESRFQREKVHEFYEKFGFEKHGYEFRINFNEVEEQN